MKTATRLICSTALLTGAFFVSSTMACTTSAWTDADGMAVAGDPVNDGIPRVSGFCGLEIQAATHVVGDNSPADETTLIARLYFFPNNVAAGTHTIFTALSDQTDPNSLVFSINYDGANINVDATAVGGDTASAAADTTHWNLIEVLWTSGGQGELYVNGDAADVDVVANDTFGSGTGSIDRVTLGNANAGVFDDYESHRSLPVGALLVGDSNNDGQVNGLDISGILKESNFFTPELQAGTPDCNLDGSVNGLDISGILKAADFFNPVPCG